MQNVLLGLYLLIITVFFLVYAFDFYTMWSIQQPIYKKGDIIMDLSANEYGCYKLYLVQGVENTDYLISPTSRTDYVFHVHINIAHQLYKKMSDN